MPMHDWTRVKAGIFHDFHHAWIEEIKRTLNGGLLPPNHYALAEQLTSGYGPDVLTLEGPWASPVGDIEDAPGGVALAEVKPKVTFHTRSEEDLYATKANRIAIRHLSNHRVVAVIEIVSPGNKSTHGAIRTFVEKAVELLRNGIHLMILDPFPPGPRDPQGIHPLIWQEIDICNFELPKGRLLTMASYLSGFYKEAYIEPIAVALSCRKCPCFSRRKDMFRFPWKQPTNPPGKPSPPSGGMRWRLLIHKNLEGHATTWRPRQGDGRISGTFQLKKVECPPRLLKLPRNI